MAEEPTDLAAWLAAHGQQIAYRWVAEVRTREGRTKEDGDGLLGAFLENLVSFLPACLGDYRERAEEVWQQSCQLYGVFALRRGLSAGEVVEELHLLGEVVLRLLLEGPRASWEDRRFKRDLLALNRILNVGVVRASVSYVDDLFFAHLQGSGVPERVTPELEEEIMRQLQGFRRDLRP